MKHLSIEEYDEVERAARVAATYPAIRAFSPVAFSQVNFPTRVTAEQELLRYADIMYELLPQKEWLETKPYSPKEADLILQLVGQIEKTTSDLFGRGITPLMCLFPPMPIVRAVEAVAAARKRRLKVFEIGPGSAHLGAYFLNLGHRYAAMDNCQALYLWQNRLLNSIATECDEWAARDASPAQVFEKRATHIPWWHFAKFFARLPAQADVVVCDAALGEMDIFALRYIIRVVKQMIAESDCGAFVFQNLGEERVTSRASLEAQMSDLGFVVRKIGGVSVFTLGDSLSDVFPAEMQEPPYIGGADGLQPPCNFLTIDRDRLLESYDFFQYIQVVPPGYPQPTASAGGTVRKLASVPNRLR